MILQITAKSVLENDCANYCKISFGMLLCKLQQNQFWKIIVQITAK
jgi:hypothetical protein